MYCSCTIRTVLLTSIQRIFIAVAFTKNSRTLGEVLTRYVQVRTSRVSLCVVAHLMLHDKQKSVPPSMRELLSETTTKNVMQQSLTLQNVMQQSMSLQGVMQQSMAFHSIHVKHSYRKKQIFAFFIRSIAVCNPNFMMQHSLWSTEQDATCTKKDIV